VTLWTPTKHRHVVVVVDDDRTPLCFRQLDAFRRATENWCELEQPVIHTQRATFSN